MFCTSIAVCHEVSIKVSIFFISRPFQPKAGLPRGGGVKNNTLPVKQQVGFEPGTFGLQLTFLTTTV